MELRSVLGVMDLRAAADDLQEFARERHGQPCSRQWHPVHAKGEWDVPHNGYAKAIQEYRVLTAQLESLYNQSSSFTLQTLYFHLHPTLHTMSLLSSLCLALESDAVAPGSDASDDDGDGLGGMAEELGLGGAGLKGLMKNLNAQDGVLGGGGLVLGGEVLGIVCERETTMSG